MGKPPFIGVDDWFRPGADRNRSVAVAEAPARIEEVLVKAIGVIPARGNSKAIPRKNLASLCGKPLIWWTLKEAIKSKRLNDLIISTEDEKLACEVDLMLREWIVEWSGLLRPRIEMRPYSLAHDKCPTSAVLRWHAGQQDVPATMVMCLQPTCPLRRAEDIDRAVELMERYQCDSVVSYVSVGANHPARMAHIAGANRVFPLDKLQTFNRRQDLDEVYIRSGDIYLTKREVLESGSMVGKDQRALVIPRDRHCNIDERMDLLLAEVQMKELQVST